jgi:hypothetical protein
MRSYINKLYITTSIFLSSVAFIKAQGVTEAMRYSYTGTGGTARTIGVGGAFGAMGGDYSVVNINPAGIGMYKKGEFTISPSFSSVNSSAYLAGQNNRVDRSKNALGLDNLGIVITNRKGTSSFSIGMTKIADLNKNFAYSGKSIGSITERFKERANGKKVDNLDDFEAYAAYNVGAIFDADSNRIYESDFNQFDSPGKTQRVSQAGYINELSFSWAANKNDKLYYGISIGVPFINFEEVKTYEETDPSNANPIFTSLKYDEYLQSSGVGVNLKAGVVLQPIKGLRIGGAIHTPTYYNINDDYNTSLVYNYYDGKDYSYNYQSPDGSFKYQYNTPAKLIGSLGYLYNFGPVKGFINGDVEYVDYNTGRFDFTAYSDDPSERTYTDDINEEIEQYLGSALNFRLGTELGYKKLRLRAGIENAQDPVSANQNKIRTLSYGIGYRDNNFFIDFAYRTRNNTEGYVPYVLIDPARETLVNTEVTMSKAVATLGFKF